MPIGDDTFAYRRYLPHLQKSGKTYFVTFCTRDRRILDPASRDIVLSCCVRDHRTAYWLHCVCVMPDHVHLVFTPFELFNLAIIMNRIKGVSSHGINKALNHAVIYGSVSISIEQFDLMKTCERRLSTSAAIPFAQDSRPRSMTTSGPGVSGSMTRRRGRRRSTEICAGGASQTAMEKRRIANGRGH
jgi:REP element-mobilizing transposase RayT